ncbi:hypothetical protein [Propylenella binzhouense]|uniref:PepSY domain-containing protein n=1 Tax=Propylenella binzhouense TaxID=2555902 RepID=A0A964T3L9_9HYPH|nr:hypothetical protein [Propylenella binzhouense]MYZ47694.1 hypothetical protein [Propylenella binzhouense]
MLRTALPLAAFGLAASASVAAAGSVGFGVRVGAMPPIVYPVGPAVGVYAAPPVREMPAAIPPEEVRLALARAGYDGIGPVRPAGGLYAIEAFDPNGILLDLRISPVSGEIVSFVPVRAALPAGSWAQPPAVAVLPAPAPVPRLSVAPAPPKPVAAVAPRTSAPEPARPVARPAAPASTDRGPASSAAPAAPPGEDVPSAPPAQSADGNNPLVVY